MDGGLPGPCLESPLPWLMVLGSLGWKKLMMYLEEMEGIVFGGNLCRDVPRKVFPSLYRLRQCILTGVFQFFSLPFLLFLPPLLPHFM